MHPLSQLLKLLDLLFTLFLTNNELNGSGFLQLSDEVGLIRFCFLNMHVMLATSGMTHDSFLCPDQLFNILN